MHPFKKLLKKPMKQADLEAQIHALDDDSEPAARSLFNEAVASPQEMMLHIERLDSENKILIARIETLIARLQFTGEV